MKGIQKQEELLNRLVWGEVEEGDLQSLIDYSEQDPAFASHIRKELEFSEMIRQAFSGENVAEESLRDGLELSDKVPLSFLIQQVREGHASSAECNVLARRIMEDPSLASELRSELKQDEYLSLAATSSKTEDSFVQGLETRMWAETFADHFVEDLEHRLDHQAPGKVVALPGNFSRKMAAVASIAAVLLVGAFFAISYTQIGASTAVAEVLKESDDVLWSEGNAIPRKDGSLEPGMYELARGVVALRFPNGQEMTVQGPARFDVKSESAAFVHSGLAMAKSTQEESKFSLQSNGVNFSESSLNFVGIDARSENATNALVFNGDVGVCLDSGGRCREIYQFEAIKADHKRDKILDIPYDPRAFTKAWELLAGVEKNLGDVRIELPGSVIQPAKSEGNNAAVQVFVENESFRLDQESRIEVDPVYPGQFASLELDHPGQELKSTGELRSYLLQLWPEEKSSTGAQSGDQQVEASLTFDHPVVGVIFSADRLENSDATVGTKLPKHIGHSRGLDSGDDSILLSEDRRTINVKLTGDHLDLDQIRVVVALN